MCKECVSRSKKPPTPKIKKQPEDQIIRTIKERVLKDIRNLFEQEKDFYKSVSVGSFCNNDYIGCESNGNRNEKLSFKEYQTILGRHHKQSPKIR